MRLRTNQQHANERFEDLELTDLEIYSNRNDTLYGMQKYLDQEFKRKMTIMKQIESG